MDITASPNQLGARTMIFWGSSIPWFRPIRFSPGHHPAHKTASPRTPPAPGGTSRWSRRESEVRTARLRKGSSRPYLSSGSPPRPTRGRLPPALLIPLARNDDGLRKLFAQQDGIPIFEDLGRKPADSQPRRRRSWAG